MIDIWTDDCSEQGMSTTAPDISAVVARHKDYHIKKVLWDSLHYIFGLGGLIITAGATVYSLLDGTAAKISREIPPSVAHAAEASSMHAAVFGVVVSLLAAALTFTKAQARANAYKKAEKRLRIALTHFKSGQSTYTINTLLAEYDAAEHEADIGS